MKKLVLFAFAMTALLFARPLAAQEKAKWTEKDAFHEVMSKTFHPAEEGKFEPIKARSGEMLEKAIAWKKSTERTWEYCSKGFFIAGCCISCR